MEIGLMDQNAVPRPPEEVRFQRVTAEPYADGRRIKLTYVLTPFQKRPNLEIRLEDEAGTEHGSITIIETMDPKFTLTAHIRSEVPAVGRLLVRSVLGYEEHPEVDLAVTPVDVAPGLPDPE
jgi:hypothetical protein